MVLVLLMLYNVIGMGSTFRMRSALIDVCVQSVAFIIRMHILISATSLITISVIIPFSLRIHPHIERFTRSQPFLRRERPGQQQGGRGGDALKRWLGVDYSKQQVMSDRKIVRLKTPTKNGQQGGRSAEDTRLESEEFSQESTILLVKSVACSEELQITLINEINKVYRELYKLRTTADNYQQENRTLKSRLQAAQRESKSQKEQYQLERDNHRRLRKFYEAREQEWVSIVNEHRRILEQCQRTPSSGPNEDQYSQLESMYTNLEQMLSNKDGKQARQSRRWARSQQDRQDSLSPKFQLNLQAQRDKDQSRDTSQTKIDLKQASSIRPRRQLEGKLTEMTPPKHADERTPPKLVNGLLQSMLRRTYQRYRQKGMNSWDIEQLQDMIKLKNAKTSTKERLAKTIRKLDFPVNNQSEIKNLCECIEKAVLDRCKSLRGDFAFDFLVQRFRNYESITQSDMHQSQIVRGQASTVRNLRITELPLESAIKDEKSRKQIIRKSLESSIRAHTPRKRPSDSGEQERMHQSHVFNRVLQPGEDLRK